MKWCTTCFVLIALTKTASAHSWRAGEKPVFNEKLRADILHDWEKQQDGQKQSATPHLVAAGATNQKHRPPPQAAPFISFGRKVEAKWDDHFLYIESNGIP